MSVVVYRGISLEIVNTREHRREIVNSPDGTTYLWTKWTFDFDCRYHIRATSYTEFPVAGSPLGAVAAIPGRSPFQTDTVLRKYLSQHRGVLRVDTGGGRLLTSPATGFGLDANNGPIVEACNVERVLGDKQFLVRLRITTCINECDRNVTASANPDYTNINPVVSHRWSRREDVDQDHYSTIVTEGEVIFRSDWLNRLGTFPDAYRRDFAHPIPNNYQRDTISVEPTSGGNGAKYIVVDKEKPFNFGDQCPATRIEAYQTAFCSVQGAVDTMLAMIPDQVAGAYQAMQGGLKVITGQESTGAREIAQGGGAVIGSMIRHTIR